MFNFLWFHLPDLAQRLVHDTWPDIDDPLAHEPKWHQWGILTHTQRVWLAMQLDVPTYCEQWQLPYIAELRREKIGSHSKWALLLVACIVHDLGKWVGRQETAVHTYSFKGHESLSEQLIRHNSDVRAYLQQAGLQTKQLDYIATVAGLHYELGKVRRLGYQSGDFDHTFLQSDLFHTQCRQISARHPSYVREIGLIYLADSLGKIDFHPTLHTLDDVQNIIRRDNLSPNLLRAACQVSLNIAMCHAYLTNSPPIDLPTRL